MTAPTLPEPLDGPEYTDVVERVLLAHHCGLTVSGVEAARLVATVEATRRLVDELRLASGLDDLIRTDWESIR